MASVCCVADCLSPTHAGGLRCAGHAKQHELGKAAAPLRERLPLRERVLALCISLADADAEDDDAYEAAWDALRKALEQWRSVEVARRAAVARSVAMTPERRSEIARLGALARAASQSPERRRAVARMAVQARIKLASKLAGGSSAPQQAGSRRGRSR